MSKFIQAVRGMNDCLPEQSPHWQYVESVLRALVTEYGYQELRTPVVESTELFKRSIGEVTDIVEKEMYTFDDRNGDSLTLRPEGTASCVRAGNQHGLLYNQQRRLWYMGPMFRHERPQKGRYRQFHQIGVETFGFDGPDIETELLLMGHDLWQRLGVDGEVTLEINSLGSSESRAAYKRALIDFLQPKRAELDEDSLRRLETNPLRILDSKVPQTQEVLADAPSLKDFFDEESRAHFDTLTEQLDGLGISYRINERLVRGLDYYNRTVFEWTTTRLGAQATVCAGGRYDGLVEQLGGKATSACGFAIGIERLLLLLETLDLLPTTRQADIYVTNALAANQGRAFAISKGLRAALPGLKIVQHCGGGNLKKQLKKADALGAKVAILVSDSDLASGQFDVKVMDGSLPQASLTEEALLPFCKQLF